MAPLKNIARICFGFLSLFATTFYGSKAVAQLSQSNAPVPAIEQVKPVGEWRLDEGSGTEAKDSSPNGYHGTFRGNPEWKPGVFGTALFFDGREDSVIVGDKLDLTQEITISLHAQFSNPRFMSLLCNFRNLSPDSGYCLHVGDKNFRDSGQITFQVFKNNSAQFITTTASYNDGKWHHIVASFGPNGISLSVDGEELKESRRLSEIGSSPNFPLRFGEYSAGGFFFSGMLDHILIFDRQMTPSAVALYEPTLTTATTTTTTDTASTTDTTSTTGTTTTATNTTTGTTNTSTTTTTTQPDCDDRNVCTDDSVSASGECLHTFNTSPCNDGNLCTTGDICNSGVCKAGDIPLICPNDDNICTQATCDSAVGCKTESITAEESCYTGPSTTQGHGVCKDGKATCTDGILGMCANEVTPTDEVCGDHLDNDCDSETDEGCITCGNGIPEAGEDCDEGSPNGSQGHCTNDCRTPICGDGNVCNGVEAYNPAHGCQTDSPLAAPQINSCQQLGICDPVSGWIVTDHPQIGSDCEASINATCTLLGQNVCNETGTGFICKASEEMMVDVSPIDSIPDVCPACGNGRVDLELNEQCDGEAGSRGSHQACDDQCQLVAIPHCGDGNFNEGESCDEGGLNGTGGHCTADCRIPDCNDGNICNGVETYNPAHGCQSGSPLLPPTANGCQAVGTCDPVNGFTLLDHPDTGNFCEYPVNETCTLAAALACDEATQTLICRPGEATLRDSTPADGLPDVCPACGNGHLDPELNEQCDGEAGVTERFACTESCQLVATPYCGNGTINEGEECDEGALNGTEGHCTFQCHAPNCNDGNICNGDETYNLAHGCETGSPLRQPEIRYCEVIGECDRTNGWQVIDHCAICGNGSVEEGEVCDDGTMNGQTGYCDIICGGVTPMPCGNGVIDEREECDDGNLLGGDGCTANCYREVNLAANMPVCGDGIINQESEECDDGNNVAGDGCTASCHSEVAQPEPEPEPETQPVPLCGDGMINQETEECDDGNNVPRDGCTASCHSEAAQPEPAPEPVPVPEPEPEPVPEPGPDLIQAIPFCGDGILNGEEFCDAGRENSNEIVGACRIDCSAFVPEPEPEPIDVAFPACSSEIFDCEKSCSIESPFTHVRDVTTLYPENFEKQIFMFAGDQGNEKGGIAFKASRNMSSDCRFEFQTCSLPTDPFDLLKGAQIDGVEANDAVGVSKNRYFTLLNLDDLFNVNAEGCLTHPKPILEGLETERRWIEEGVEGKGHVQRILEIAPATTSDGRTGILLGGVEINGDEPELMVFPAIDIFVLKNDGDHLHHFVPLQRLNDGDVLTGLTFDLLENGTENTHPFNTYITRQTPAGSQTDYYQCGTREEKWKCSLIETFEEEAPLVLVAPNTVRRQSQQKSIAEESQDRLFISKTGHVRKMSHKVPAGDHHASAAIQIRQDGEPLDPSLAEKAFDAWFAAERHNVAKPNDMAAKLYSLQYNEEALFQMSHLEAENLTADAPLNGVQNNEERQYKGMHHLHEFKRNNFGGNDFAGFFDILQGEEKVGTIVTLFHNKNEAPTITLHNEIPKNQTAILTAFPQDLMKDPLRCRVTLQDANGIDLAARAKMGDCREVGEDGIPVEVRLDGIVSENAVIQGNVSKAEGVAQPEIAWPLSGQVCAVDEGGLEACTPFSLNKSIVAKQVELPASPAPENQIIEESATSPIEWAISGGGLACIQNISTAGTIPSTTNLLELALLALSLLGTILWRARTSFQKN